MQQAEELLKHDADLGVDLEARLVAHVQCAHELEGGDLERIVEGRDDRDGAVREAKALGALARVVTRRDEALREEAHAIAAEVLEELARDEHLAHRLRLALRRDAHDQIREEGRHLRRRERLPDARGHLAVRDVPLRQLERVVQARFRTRREARHERRDALARDLVYAYHGVPGERIGNVARRRRALDPFASDEAAHLTEVGRGRIARRPPRCRRHPAQRSARGRREDAARKRHRTHRTHVGARSIAEDGRDRSRDV